MNEHMFTLKTEGPNVLLAYIPHKFEIFGKGIVERSLVFPTSNNQKKKYPFLFSLFCPYILIGQGLHIHCSFNE